MKKYLIINLKNMETIDLKRFALPQNELFQKAIRLTIENLKKTIEKLLHMPNNI